MTSHLALLGHPVAHSRSPAMMGAAFKALALDATYAARDVLPEALADAIAALREPYARGANVTVPYKVGVCALLDRLDPTASAIGAVNTIVRDGGSLVGHNTDARGLVRALTEASVTVAGAHIVVLGAGGAARAAVVGCALAHAARVTVIARDEARAREVAARAAIAPNTRSDGCALGSLTARDALAEAHVLVQATPCGMLGGPSARDLLDRIDLTLCDPRCTAVDLVYNPRETDFLRACRALKLSCLDGLGMLAHQGAEALELWFDVRAPLDAMRAALNVSDAP